MHPTTTPLLLLLVLTAVATFAGRATGTDTGTGNTTTLCVPRERDALLAFKRGITEDLAGRLASWRRGSDCCQWSGVRCSNRTGHVVELRLRNYKANYYDRVTYHGQLVGFIGDTYLNGPINPSLFSLEHLKHLDLGWNLLYFPSGGRHSSEVILGSMKNLRYLNLSHIEFDDNRLLPHLGNLSKLQYLDLSDTIYSVQPTDLSWLTRLPLLQHLALSRVDLSMVHDWPHIVNMIPSLEVLYLSNSSLQNANQRLPHLNLTTLERLDLSYNYLDNPSESCWFWNLTSLKYLNLGSNLLYGQFPNTLGQMTSLQVFDFSNNKITSGTNRAPIVMAPNLMRNLCLLEVLNLEDGLSYGNMTELYESMSHCLPNRLRELNLGGNNIVGTLPAGIGQFTRLVSLRLSNNHLTGVITEEHFFGLTSLTHIDLSNNPLKIVLHPDRLPPLILKIASFASCQIGPTFPSWLQRLVIVGSLDMSNTSIADQLPHWFSRTLSLATLLDFSDNQINGSLPTNLESMSLDTLLLDRNQITGETPPLPINISWFSISNNSLSGHIPRSFCKSHQFEILDLSKNLFEGGFPNCIEMRGIQALILSNNMFTGKFPSFLQNCTEITVLDLSGNKLYGRLPGWIGEFTRMQYLRLSYNMFSGSIPFSITNLGEMYDLNLAGNRFSGNIPRNLSNLTGMEDKRLCYLIDSFTDMNNLLPVVTKGQELYYQSSRTGVVSIDLSLNYLTGVIPEETASLGCMVNLNLSWNSLSGKIPHKIGSMPSLESLDLSRNKLSGEIPPSVSNLTYLAYLDLSYNNLSGRIPSGSQLDTLYDKNPFMYSGNEGLCGPPLQRNCSGGNNATRLTDGGQKRSARVPDQIFFSLGLGSGFVLGLWVVFCTMLFKKTWRIAYFRLFDKAYDKLYAFVVISWARLAQKTLQVTRNLC